MVTSTVLPTTTSSTSSLTASGTNTALQTTLACACGFQACPINLGGGCCPNDRACAIGNTCPPASGTNTIPSSSCTVTATVPTATASAPFRPTSASDVTQSTTTAPIVTGGSCPTGFYACSAVYAGGCCRTGRDCATTNCPATASATIVSSGITLVVPLVGAATSTASGSCANGWSSCAASLGGSCCPSGWDCGTESCTSAGATSTSTQTKGNLVLGDANLGKGSGAIWVTFASVVFVLVA